MDTRNEDFKLCVLVSRINHQENNTLFAVHITDSLPSNKQRRTEERQASDERDLRTSVPYILEAQFICVTNTEDQDE